ncbi:MAG TPA: DUF721 domain-containing protein [Ignavibacteriaceae bacterium]|nr:DUF721 domain-containing protein [Ignavibacteriaceae bacterium]
MLKDFVSIGEIINNEPGFEKIRNVIKQSDVAIDFPAIFPALEKIAKPVKVEKKVLYLKVENPAWRSELKFQDAAIIGKINKHYNEERIKWIKFLP